MNPDPLRFSPLPPRVLFPAAGVGMLWSGLRLGNSTLALCGLVLLALSALAWGMSDHVRRGLAVGRRHHPRVFEEGVAHVKVIVENHGRLPAVGLEIRDSFPPGETYHVKVMDRRVLWPRRGEALLYRRVCTRHRGVYAIGPLTIMGADPAGLFPFSEELPLISELLVYPKSEGLTFFPLLAEGMLTRVGEEILPRPGESVEFRGVRDWIPSDGQRHVHWRTTARLGRLMARELEQNVVTEVTIALDLRRVALSGLGDHSTLEYAVKAAASITQTAVDRQHLVQLWGLGADPVTHLPFGAGAEQVTSVLDLLTLVRPDGTSDYAEGFERMIPTLRRGATLVLIVAAAAFDWPRMEPRLRSLIQDDVRLVAVIVDDRSFLPIFREQDRLLREAPDFESLPLHLREIGARVFTVALREDVRRRLQTPV